MNTETDWQTDNLSEFENTDLTLVEKCIGLGRYPQAYPLARSQIFFK